MNAQSSAAVAASLQVDYADPARLPALLADPQVLAVFGFHAGTAPAASDDPRYLQVALQADGVAQLEVWRSDKPVSCGRDANGVAWASDGTLMFGALQVEESSHGGIAGAAEYAYAQLLQTLPVHGYPHLLRIWNYLDAITDGEGDNERYREFCVGRARGIGDIDTRTLPAARRSAAATAYACCRCTGGLHAVQARRWKTRDRSVPTVIRASTAGNRPVLPVPCLPPPAASCRCCCPAPLAWWAMPPCTATARSASCRKPSPISMP